MKSTLKSLEYDIEDNCYITYGDNTQNRQTRNWYWTCGKIVRNHKFMFMHQFMFVHRNHFWNHNGQRMRGGRWPSSVYAGPFIWYMTSYDIIWHYRQVLSYDIWFCLAALIYSESEVAMICTQGTPYVFWTNSVCFPRPGTTDQEVIKVMFETWLNLVAFENYSHSVRLLVGVLVQPGWI